MNAVNLLPLQQQPLRLQSKHSVRFLGWALGVVFIVLILFYLFFTVKIGHVQQDVLQWQMKIDNQAVPFSKAKNLAQNIATYQNKIAQITLHQDENKRLMGFLRALPALMTDDLYLVNLSWHAHSGIIYGQALEHQAVVAFVHALKNTPYFKKIELVKSDRRHEKDKKPPIYFVIHFYANA